MNPSLFIRLPKLSGGKWREIDVIDAVDNLNYGIVEKVSICANSNGEQNAVVHFERWFRGAEEVAHDILRGIRLTVPAMYGKSFVLNHYRPVQRTYERDPRNARDYMKPSRSHSNSNANSKYVSNVQVGEDIEEGEIIYSPRNRTLDHSRR